MDSGTQRNGVTLADLTAAWDEIDALRQSEGLDVVDSAPPGSFTQGEYAERYQLPYSTAQTQLARLVNGGKLATVKVRRFHGGKIREMRVYWKP